MDALFVRVSLGLALLLAASPLHAQEVALGPPDPDQKEETRHPRGSYMGVKPGGPEAPAIAATPGATPAAITWPGFQMRADGSSRVFLQTTSPISAAPVLRGGKLVVDLGDARVEGETNRLPLYTQFFNSPVTQIAITYESGRTLLELSLRASVQPRVSSERAPSGFHFIYLDFPPGNYLAKAPPQSLAPAHQVAGEPEAAAPSHLEGEASASGQAKPKAQASGSASGSAGLQASDGELPPGMGKPKAKAKAKGRAGFSLGK